MENLKNELAEYCDLIIKERIEESVNTSGGLQGLSEKILFLKNNVESLQEEIIPLINSKAKELYEKYQIEPTDETQNEVRNIIMPKLRSIIKF
ncbi:MULTISPECIES: hypothetical protein [unclassified Dysgonomonas]|jgi:hypothetical protein|uniref:hypothetical protein n=1 Tax=unclassified Dysgonomonas TaxID=2630389 RepID=UPI0025C353D9|nr:MULTISPECIES: hypothetical protein [unclassified Dysgonomonas]MDR2004081.1 hypothetical protein [Prevotella sp.]HMM04531.1 hypothetical protein [Dysgonomonas sp.]